MSGCNRFDAKVVPIAVEIDRKCGLNAPRAIVCDGRRFEIARVGATLPCPSMFGKADATVTGVVGYGPDVVDVVGGLLLDSHGGPSGLLVPGQCFTTKPVVSVENPTNGLTKRLAKSSNQLLNNSNR